jgi:glycosyltransferase involved in cell wall biosynthesis
MLIRTNAICDMAEADSSNEKSNVTPTANTSHVRLSVVIPAFNEVRTLDAVIERVRETALNCELIIVDDGSTDGTRNLLTKYESATDVVVVLHDENRGKGAALKTGFLRATGDIVLVQDADLEYDPKEYRNLIQPILDGRADVVFGSRYHAGNSERMQRSWHTKANRFVTSVSNRFTGLQLSDMETCYKAFRREVIQKIAPTLQETGFGIEPELTAKLARLAKGRIEQVPIDYAPRTYSEGKKINWRDGIWAIWCCMRY